MGCLNNWPYKDIISIDTIFAKLDKAWADERKGMLTSPDELRRAALEGKANIEYVDGVEVITLMGCDYKFVISSMRAKRKAMKYIMVIRLVMELLMFSLR